MESVKGINETIRELRKFGKDVEKQINGLTEDAALAVAEEAKKRAPKNFGKLAQSISVASDIKTKGVIQRVTVNEKYGAYVEFGTGAKVNVPPGFEEIANSFKGKKTGTFKDFLEAMTIWFKAKGYDTKYVWIACINKINNGMNPQPFLYPAFVKGKKEYLNDLKTLLSKLNKKI